MDCLKHFRGEEIFSCLKDLKNYDEVCEEFKDESYKESFRCYIDNFEKIIENKKSRIKNISNIIEFTLNRKYK